MRKEKEGRDAYQVISSWGFCSLESKVRQVTYPCAGDVCWCSHLPISCPPEVCQLWTGAKHLQDTRAACPVAGHCYHATGGGRKGLEISLQCHNLFFPSVES